LASAPEARRLALSPSGLSGLGLNYSNRLRPSVSTEAGPSTLDAVAAALETPEAAAAEEHGGVVPEHIVILVEA
jgi:hypothetical protein